MRLDAITIKGGSMQEASATFEVQSWLEEAAMSEQPDGQKLTRAHAVQTFKGDLEGTSEISYLMCYGMNGEATFVGFERFTGTLRGREGSFVLRHEGCFEEGQASSHCVVVSGSGQRGLRNLRGQGEFVAKHGVATPFSFAYEIFERNEVPDLPVSRESS